MVKKSQNQTFAKCQCYNWNCTNQSATRDKKWKFKTTNLEMRSFKMNEHWWQHFTAALITQLLISLFISSICSVDEKAGITKCSTSLWCRGGVGGEVASLRQHEYWNLAERSIGIQRKPVTFLNVTLIDMTSLFNLINLRMLTRSYLPDILPTNLNQKMYQIKIMPCTYCVKKSSNNWTKGISGSSSCLHHALENDV